MKKSLIKPILFFVLVFVAVSLACGPATDVTEEPEVEASPQPVEVDTPVPAEPTEEEAAEPAEPVSPSGAVTNLEDVQGAVVQIRAEGTFVDPEIGEYVGAGSGSGFIIDPSGLAVTNNHVVTGAALLKVWIGGDTSTTYNAKVLGVSECSDLALIDIDGEGFPYLEWYQQPVKVGLDVYAVGFPLGEPEYTLTKGIISKESASGETNWASIDSVVMHDATINPGNSGGPLVTSEGKVVGVNYRARPAQDQYFTIGREIAMPIIDQLKTGQDVDSIGVNGVAVQSEDGTISGIWVSSVEAGSASDQAGIKGGDIILRLQDLPLAADGTMSGYCDVIRTHNPGDAMGVEVLRFATYEVLEGQLNGDALAQSYYFGDTAGTSGSDTGGDTGADTGGTTTGDYISVSDSLGALYLEVPSWYTEYDDTMWEADWGNLHFKAASLVVAPNVDSYYSYYDSPGVHLAASEDWGDIGGYIQLLDAAGDTWYREDCEYEGRYDYEDPVYEGAADVWKCAQGAESWVLAARPIEDPFAFLVLMQVQTVGEYDPEYVDLQRMFDTFDVSRYDLP
jgi:serine protease Do